MTPFMRWCRKTQNVVLRFHCNNGYANAPLCKVTVRCRLTDLLYVLPCCPVTLLSCYLALLLPCSPVTLLSCHLAVLLPCCPVTLLSCYLALLLPCSPVTVLSCYLAVLLPCSPVTLLSCYHCTLTIFTNDNGSPTILTNHHLMFRNVTRVRCIKTQAFTRCHHVCSTHIAASVILLVIPLLRSNNACRRDAHQLGDVLITYFIRRHVLCVLLIVSVAHLLFISLCWSPVSAALAVCGVRCAVLGQCALGPYAARCLPYLCSR
jgi:hypothetical protein